MRARNREAFCRNHVEHAQARFAGEIRIKIVFHRGIRMRNLDCGEMHQIAPSDKSVAAGTDAPAGVAGGMTGRELRCATQYFLPFPHGADAIAIRLHVDLRARTRFTPSDSEPLFSAIQKSSS